MIAPGVFNCGTQLAELRKIRDEARRDLIPGRMGL